MSGSFADVVRAFMAEDADAWPELDAAIKAVKELSHEGDKGKGSNAARADAAVQTTSPCTPSKKIKTLLAVSP